MSMNPESPALKEAREAALRVSHLWDAPDHVMHVLRNGVAPGAMHALNSWSLYERQSRVYPMWKWFAVQAAWHYAAAARHYDWHKGDSKDVLSFVKLATESARLAIQEAPIAKKQPPQPKEKTE